MMGNCLEFLYDSVTAEVSLSGIVKTNFGKSQEETLYAGILNYNSRVTPNRYIFLRIALCPKTSIYDLEFTGQIEQNDLDSPGHREQLC